MKILINLLSFYFLLYTLIICTKFHNCHKLVTPNIVTDWQLSKHSANEVDCSVCHGTKRNSAKNVDLVELPTPENCKTCHETQVTQFSKGKHATCMGFHERDAHRTHAADGFNGRNERMRGCHKIGLKTDDDIKKLKAEGSGYGRASCDACHTRHTFSVNEAKQPQACQPSHMGFDHPQWEMYSSSKHGVRYLLKQNGTLPENTSAPTCQSCHMQEGNHEVRTAWGFLAVRLPMPDDKQWTEDRATILQGLGVLDPNGNPTARIEAVKAADIARLTQESWQKERDKMIKTCGNCHSEKFAIGELEKGDKMIREADHLMAEGIRIIAGLYKDGIVPKPTSYAYAFPDLLTFHDAPTSIEQKLFVMFLQHRMRAFQGTFHSNPDYALWYGWSELQRDLQEIKEMAAALRKEHVKR